MPETQICSECGSTNIGYDAAHDSKYCRKCGTIIEEFRYE